MRGIQLAKERYGLPKKEPLTYMSKGWRGLLCGMRTEGPKPGFRKSAG